MILKTHFNLKMLFESHEGRNSTTHGTDDGEEDSDQDGVTWGTDRAQGAGHAVKEELLVPRRTRGREKGSRGENTEQPWGVRKDFQRQRRAGERPRRGSGIRRGVNAGERAALGS